METQDWDLDLETKVSITTKLNGSAKVYAYQYDDSFQESLISWDPIDKASFSFNGDELKSPTPVRWGLVESNKIKLFVYTPTGNIPGATLPATQKVTGTPTISYTLPPDRKDHVDLITSVKEVPAKGQDGYNKTVPLTFTHAFTALKFKMGFPCTVKSITISGVYNKGDYKIGTGWTNLQKVLHSGNSGDYTISFDGGKTVAADADLIDDVFMMIPQDLVATITGTDGNQTTVVPTVSVTFNSGDGDITIKASLVGQKWEEGKLITYTLYKKTLDEYIYFDLDAGDITINASSYTGYIRYNGGQDVHKVTGTHKSTNKYYVYQSSNSNKSTTGWTGAVGSTLKLPVYDQAYVSKGNGTEKVFWSDYITNNRSVASVILAWDNKEGNSGAAHNVGRDSTNHKIYVSGAVGICDLYIDNIYSRYNHASTGRSHGSISFVPGTGVSNSKLIINSIGDNRLSSIHYNNAAKTNYLVLQGAGSLTVADADFNIENDSNTGKTNTDNPDTCFYSNHWNAAIGNNDSAQEVEGIEINSGVIFAGTTKAENCSAIGGGGNGKGVIVINGGVITAVATTTGTAIGGGIGFNSAGGEGTVTINGGNIYAYNHANKWGIPSSAIGGAGSSKESGKNGTVIINGGNVYAQSALGTAIGAGSSATKEGGNATVHINDGIVVAKSGVISAGIGGGNSCTNNTSNYSGGNATIVIGEFGKPIVRTGSIGGGQGSKGGAIGSAKITIYNGDIQAQFVMASSPNNEFVMRGGSIRNSYHSDGEYKHTQLNGGAVYMQKGTFRMTGGSIKNCSGENGGAVYVEGDENTTFTMIGGSIEKSNSRYKGGAVYLKGGKVILRGGKIVNNLASEGNGGGIYVEGGNFVMEDTTGVDAPQITGNAAFSNSKSGCGSGGGIYVTSNEGNVSVELFHGEISNNTSDRTGGGVGVDVSGGINAQATVVVGQSGASTQFPDIKGNRASLLGGGLYVNGLNANIIINDGRIMGNHTSGYVSNPNVANEGGMVTLNGGEVTHVIVTYMPNAPSSANVTVTDQSGQSVEYLNQKIVTSTNSKMLIPGTFTRPRWVIGSWHTRPDGDDSRGIRYTPGQILNLSENVTLYAQWVEESGS